MPVPPRWRRRLRVWIRRSSLVWWLGVAALALVTASVVRSSLASADALAQRYGALRLVPVVVSPVDAGEALPRSAVRMAERPASTLPDAPLARGGAAGAAGRTALVPLVPGEVLVASKLAPAGLRGAAALLPRGMRAVAIPGGPGGRPPAAVGDRVDILATFSEAASSHAAGGPPTVVVAARALVLALDTESDTVTVAVPPDDLPAVVFAITAGTVTLALTSP